MRTGSELAVSTSVFSLQQLQDCVFTVAQVNSLATESGPFVHLVFNHVQIQCPDYCIK